MTGAEGATAPGNSQAGEPHRSGASGKRAVDMRRLAPPKGKAGAPVNLSGTDDRAGRRPSRCGLCAATQEVPTHGEKDSRSS